MNTKGWVKAALWGLLGTLALWGGRAEAADADSDSLTVRITPNVDYGVNIDSATSESGGVINLGTLNLYASTQTVRPSTVTITGNVSASGGSGGQELDVSTSIAGGWVFDQTPSTDSTSGSVNELAGYALFSATTLSVAPNGDDFANATANAGLGAGPLRAGGLSGTGAKFEKQGTGTVDMDNKSVGNAAHLWLFFRLPNQASLGAAQDVTVTLTATGTSL